MKIDSWVDKFRSMLHWALAGLVSYSVGATLFIKTMTVDITSLRDNVAQAGATIDRVATRQTNVEIDVVRAVEGFRSDMTELKTEVKLLRRQIEKSSD
jgi:hypothetical protein